MVLPHALNMWSGMADPKRERMVKIQNKTKRNQPTKEKTHPFPNTHTIPSLTVFPLMASWNQFQERQSLTFTPYLALTIPKISEVGYSIDPLLISGVHRTKVEFTAIWAYRSYHCLYNTSVIAIPWALQDGNCVSSWSVTQVPFLWPCLWQFCD